MPPDPDLPGPDGPEPERTPGGGVRRPPRRGLLAGMRIRKKLIVLHTTFSVILALILLVALRPAIAEIVSRSELSQAVHVLELSLGELERQRAGGEFERSVDEGRIVFRAGGAVELGLDPEFAAFAREQPGHPLAVRAEIGRALAAVYVPGGAGVEGRFWTASVAIPEARRAVWRVYVLTILALLVIYALVAIALEAFVLPQQVYAPIRALLSADRAVREGDRAGEVIPERQIPADELGEIMRSRNDSILRLREQEARLADALDRLERVAGDLKRKNHLLERARRNLEGADRLASLGMMSAGIAHELNTPLAVAKGLVEKLAERPERGLSDSESALLVRVIGRLERLSESLLDFARAREPGHEPTAIRGRVEEAVGLVRLDRQTDGPRAPVEVVNAVPAGLIVECDGDRMVQVFVNLVRNAVDAIRGHERGGRVTVEGREEERDGERWAVVTVTDTGPGIDPAVLPRLFEPFVTSRLDAKGTGLGLAVAEGIVKEHGGTLIARDRPGRSGAVFEVMLPSRAPGGASPASEP